MSRVHAGRVRPADDPRGPAPRPTAVTPAVRPTAADLDARLQRARLLGHGVPPVAAVAPMTEAVQRATYTDGDNTYQTEVFDTNRERPKKVEGKVHWVSTAGRGGAPSAIARWDPTERVYDPLLGYDGGHVLGLEAGGIDRSYNVVPMLPKFNRDTWRKVEGQLTGASSLFYSGQNFRFSIDVSYANTTAKIPDSLRALGYADVPKKKKVRGEWKPTGKVEHKKVLDVTKSQPDDIEVTAAPTEEESETFQGTKPKIGKVVKGLKKHKEYDESDFLQYIAKKHHLPKSEAQEYPDKVADRPYEYLDILALSGNVFSNANYMPRREFTGTQRTLILKYNMAENGGVLKSDDPLDPHQNLSERGAANFPEVDHIIPKSQGGSNFFSNARLVSWQLNNKEDRVKDITPYIAIDRINYPALTGKEDPETLKVKGILVLKKHIHEQSLDELTLDDALNVFSIGYSQITTKKATSIVKGALAQMVADGFLARSGKRYTVQ